MTASSIRLKSLEFDDSEDGPIRVVASFPADLMYSLAAIHGAIPPMVFADAGAKHSKALYDFVSTYLANRFYDDGVAEAAPAYTVFSTAVRLAYHPTGSKDLDAPQQKLARALGEALSDLIGGDEDKSMERIQLAAMLSQVVINEGWRQVTPIGRVTHYSDSTPIR
jgi:hypothetical protein